MIKWSNLGNRCTAAAVSKIHRLESAAIPSLRLGCRNLVNDAAEFINIAADGGHSADVVFN